MAATHRVDRMRRKLKTKPYRSVYAARKTIIEPVFGQINSVPEVFVNRHY
jgi:hypothetical protein